jgi:hypothetical protein
VNLFQDLKQVLEKGVEQAGQQVEHVAEIKRLNKKLKGKKENIDEMFLRLGRKVYKKWKKDRDIVISDKMEAFLAEIDELARQIKVLEQEVDQIGNSKDNNGYHQVQPTMPSNERNRGLDTTDVKESNDLYISSVPTSVVYLCPFCIHQVSQEASICPHCQARFY